MAVIHERIETLLHYPGEARCPADLQAFWAEAQHDLEAVDPAQECRPADFQHPACEAYHLSFNSVGGARIHAQLLKPKGAVHRGPALLLYHGYTANAGDWMAKAAWAAAGFTVAAMDCRGQGGDSYDPGGQAGQTLHGHLLRGLEQGAASLAYRAHFLDAARLCDLVSALAWVDPARMGAMGGSQGGALALACAALRSRLAKVAVHYPFLSDFRRVWSEGLDQSGYGELWQYFRRRDPLHERHEQAFARLDYIDLQNLAPWVHAEALFGATLRDTACPPFSQFAVYNRLGGPKRLLAYPDHGHEWLPDWDDRAWAFFSGLLAK